MFNTPEMFKFNKIAMTGLDVLSPGQNFLQDSSETCEARRGFTRVIF